jgi:branched-chain amino acid transport system permease protein
MMANSPEIVAPVTSEPNPQGPASVTGNRRWLWVLGLMVLAFLLPMVISDFRVFQVTLALVYAIALLGLNMLTGYNGQISLGHGAFYALGAYIAAIMMDHFGMPYYVTLVPAGLLCLAVGFLFGLPALRLEGLELAVATLALAVAAPQFLKYDAFEEWTGGVQGIILDKPEVPFGLSINQDQWLYYFTLIVTFIMFVAAWNLLRGRTGRAIVAIRDHHISAETMGVNTALYKSLTFGVSAFYTGVAGALGAIVIQFVAPDSFQLFLSITFLVGIVVGGLASISGAIYGGLFILFVPNIAQDISAAAPWAIYGIFLLAFMYIMPTGVAGFVRIFGAWLARARQDPAAAIAAIGPRIRQSISQRWGGVLSLLQRKRSG